MVVKPQIVSLIAMFVFYAACPTKGEATVLRETETPPAEPEPEEPKPGDDE